MASSRGVTPVESVGEIEIRHGMVFYTAISDGHVEDRSMRVAEWLDAQLRFENVYRSYLRGCAKVAPLFIAKRV